jgi:PAS domain S-box-containing protein
LYRDVTERVRAIAELRSSEERFETVFRSAPVAMALSKVADGTFIDVNPAFTALMGYERDEVFGRTSREVGFFPDPAIRTQFVEQIIQDGSFRSEAVGVPTRDGSERLLELSVSVIDLNSERCLLTIAEDVTEQRRAEQALKDSEARFRLLAENSRDIIFRYRVAEPGGMEYISPSILRIAGYRPEEYYADPAFPATVVHPDDREAFDRMVGERLEGPIELRWSHRDGSVLWTEQTNVHIIDAEGNLLAVEGVVRDITQRKEAELALRESEERFRLLAENAHDIIFRYRLAEPRGTEYMSPSVTRIAGYTPEQYYADPDFSLRVVHPDDRDLLARMAAAMEPETVRLRWIRRDGEIVWAEQTTVPIFDDAGRLVAVEGVGRDITATVEAEEALQRARDELEGHVEREMAERNEYNLTFREFTVLHHIAAGETDKVIGSALGISPLTVHKHVASILAKMRASSRTEAGVRAIREGLLNPPQRSAE